MQTSPNDVSNEELARMIQQGFLEIAERFEGVDKQVNGITQRLEGIDQKLEKNSKEHAEMLWKLSETVTRNEHHALERRVEVLESTRA